MFFSFSSLSDRTNMFLRLALFLFFSLLVAFLLFRFFFSSPPSLITTPTEETPGLDSALPTAQPGTRPESEPETAEGDGRLPPSQVAQGGETITTQLTKGGVTSPHITSDGSLAYYDAADGRFYTMTREGEAAPLSLAQFPAAETIVFNQKASAAVLEFPDGSNLVYDFTTAQSVTLPAHWEEFSFSGDGMSIASKSLGEDPANRAIVISSADGSSTKVIAELGSHDDKVTVDWSPESTIVGFSQTGEGASAFGQHKIYTIGEDGEANGVLTVSGTNYDSIWSPSGKYILYSVADSGEEYRPRLWYVDAKGDRNGELRLALDIATTVDRCTFFNEETLYCGVPAETPVGSGTQPEILTGPDYLYKISLPSGKSELLAIPSVSTVIKHPSVTEDERTLFYTDIYERLHMIRLK